MTVGAQSKLKELSTFEVINVVNQRREVGVSEFILSGGEPMLREDFCEIFDYITAKARRYSLNTNGTLITPEIARLMKRKGTKMVAII